MSTATATASSSTGQRHRHRSRRHKRATMMPLPPIEIPTRLSSNLHRPVSAPARGMTSLMSSSNDSSASSDATTPKSVFEWTPPSSPSATSILRLPGFNTSKPSSPSSSVKHIRFKLRPVSRDRPLSSSNGLGLVLGKPQASDYGPKARRASRTLILRHAEHALTAGRLDGTYFPASPQALDSEAEQLRLPHQDGATRPLRLRRPEARRVGTSPAVMMVRSGPAMRPRLPMSSSDSYITGADGSGPLGAFERELLGMFGPQAPLSPPPRHAARPSGLATATFNPQQHPPPPRPQRPRCTSTAGDENKDSQRLAIPAGPPALPARSPLRPMHRATIGPSSAALVGASSSAPPVPSLPSPPPFDRSLAIKIPTYFDLSHEYLQDGPIVAGEASHAAPTRRRSISLSTMRSQGSRYSVISHVSEEPVEMPATPSQTTIDDSMTHSHSHSVTHSPSSSSDRSSVPSLSRSPGKTSSWLPSSPESITSSKLQPLDTQPKSPAQDWSQYQMVPRVATSHSRGSSADSVYFTPGPSPKTISICLEPALVVSRRPSSSGRVEDLLSANAGKMADRLAMAQRLRSHSHLGDVKKTQDLLEALRLDAASRLDVARQSVDRKTSATEWRFGGVGTAF